MLMCDAGFGVLETRFLVSIRIETLFSNFRPRCSHVRCSKSRLRALTLMSIKYWWRRSVLPVISSASVASIELKAKPLSCGLRCRMAGLGLKWLASRISRRLKAYGGLRLCIRLRSIQKLVSLVRLHVLFMFSWSLYVWRMCVLVC